MKKAIYPGSFDPITNGHLDIIKRGCALFDEVTITVANNTKKHYLFSMEQRIKMVREAVTHLKNVTVDGTDDLVVRHAKDIGATVLIRGLRAVTDFEFEFQLAAVNEFIDPSIEMVFLMSHRETGFISSSNIKELYDQKVDISTLVPLSVVEEFKKTY